MPSHRKPKLSAARNRARTITLCAATLGTAAVPALASAASASAATPAAATTQAAVSHAATASHKHHKATVTTAATTTYTVKAGDTLFGIAKWSLGSGYKYPQLFKLNKNDTESNGEKFTDPDLIRVGWTLKVPSSDSSSSSSGSSGSSSSSDSSGSSSSAGSSDSSSSGSASGSSSDSSSSGSSSSGSSSSTSYPDDLTGWIDQAIAILADHGYTVSYNAVYQAAMNESGGDPNAENDWDSNAAAGTPSIGLLQTIQPTFDAYALPGYDDIRNPVDNIIAAAIYAQDTYGGLDNVVAARCGGSCWYGY